MKIEFGDKLIYIDDGNFPTLNNKIATFIGIDHLYKKYYVVDFILDVGKKFRGSLPKNCFKKIKSV